MTRTYFIFIFFSSSLILSLLYLHLDAPREMSILRLWGGLFSYSCVRHFKLVTVHKNVFYQTTGFYLLPRKNKKSWNWWASSHSKRFFVGSVMRRRHWMCCQFLQPCAEKWHLVLMFRNSYFCPHGSVRCSEKSYSDICNSSEMSFRGCRDRTKVKMGG
jgi:hypothetical protein